MLKRKRIKRILQRKKKKKIREKKERKGREGKRRRRRMKVGNKKKILKGRTREKDFPLKTLSNQRRLRIFPLKACPVKKQGSKGRKEGQRGGDRYDWIGKYCVTFRDVPLRLGGKRRER